MNEEQKSALLSLDSVVAKANASRAEHVGAQNILTFLEKELTELNQHRKDAEINKGSEEPEPAPKPPKPQQPIKAK